MSEPLIPQRELDALKRLTNEDMSASLERMYGAADAPERPSE